MVSFVTRTVRPKCITSSIHFTRPVSRANSDTTETILKRFKQVSAKAATGGEGKRRIVRGIKEALRGSDLAVEEIAHKEVRGQPFPPEGFKLG